MDIWLKRQRREQFLEPPSPSHDVGAFLLQRQGIDLSNNDDIVFPNDEFIVANYTNNNAWPNNAQEPSHNAPPPARMLSTDRRSRLTQHIWENGIRFDLQADNDFTFVRTL